MTVRSLSRLLDVGATTTAKSGRQHVRKLPERTRAVNRFPITLFESARKIDQRS
jgi:hypothetical protein